MSTISKNWSKVKQAIKNLFSFQKKKKQFIPSVTTKEIILPEESFTKRMGRGRAFKNRKTTRGRRSQYIPMFTDQLGRVHYKLICHSY